jgi:acetolactate synthase-1/2/3 large subunit
MVHQWQDVFYGKRFSSSEPNRLTDYKAVIEGFGGRGYRCQTPAEFESAMKEALSLNVPVWIECIVDRDEKVLPMIPGGKTVNDTIFD